MSAHPPCFDGFREGLAGLPNVRPPLFAGQRFPRRAGRALPWHLHRLPGQRREDRAGVPLPQLVAVELVELNEFLELVGFVLL